MSALSNEDLAWRLRQTVRLAHAGDLAAVEALAMSMSDSDLRVAVVAVGAILSLAFGKGTDYADEIIDEVFEEGWGDLKSAPLH